jgi:hypothetical protein
MGGKHGFVSFTHTHTHTSLVIHALQLDIAAADKDLGHAILEVKVRLLECKQANQTIKTMITT